MLVDIIVLVCLKMHLSSSLHFSFQMALLPEGITELLHHEKLRVPLVCFCVTYDKYVLES